MKIPVWINKGNVLVIFSSLQPLCLNKISERKPTFENKLELNWRTRFQKLKTKGHEASMKSVRDEFCKLASDPFTRDGSC